MERTEDRLPPASGPLRPALRASDERFRALIEATADGVLVVRPDGTIALANPAACALMGRGAQHLLGQPFGVPVVPGETTEVDICRSNGTVRIAEMRTAAITWRGKPAHLATLRDVTERKQAEDAARQALATLRSFYDGASMMMGVVELAGDDIHYISSNAATARFFAIRPEGQDGRAASRLGIPPATVDLWIDRYREAERSGTPIRFEYRHDSEAGDGPTWLYATVGFIGRDPAGRPQFSFVAEDITERKWAEQELQEASRRKDEFLAMLAHELRNPLAVIGNAARLLRAPGDRPEWPRDTIERQVRHLARLIDDLLDVSRIDQGKIRLRAERLDAGPVLRAAAEAVRPIAEARGHVLIVSIPPGPLWLDADPTRLEQIVVNLLTNSVKYTEPGGHIWLEAAVEGGSFVIRVRDDGVGIPPDSLPEMFEPFAQGERSIARSEGGLGLGLTIVKGLVEMHGGTIAARSDGPGRGSEFTVRLPNAARPEPDAGPKAAAPAAASRSARILVVDDYVEGAKAIVSLLQVEGHQARAVHDGPGGLEIARQFRPDIILLDIGLPGMDGFQVAEAIRREPSLQGTRIVAVSGYGDEPIQIRAKQAGCDLHLVKPVNIETLLATLTQLAPKQEEGMGKG